LRILPPPANNFESHESGTAAGDFANNANKYHPMELKDYPANERGDRGDDKIAYLATRALNEQ
jgi:hypothetical protein